MITIFMPWAALTVLCILALVREAGRTRIRKTEERNRFLTELVGRLKASDQRFRGGL